LSDSLDRLRRLDKGENRNCAPFSPILDSFRSTARLYRLKRLDKGDNRDYAPKALI